MRALAAAALLFTGCAPSAFCSDAGGATLVGSEDCAGLAEMYRRSLDAFASNVPSWSPADTTSALRGLAVEIDPSNSGRAYCRAGVVTVASDRWMRENLTHEYAHIRLGCSLPAHADWMSLGIVAAIEDATGVLVVGLEDE